MHFSSSLRMWPWGWHSDDDFACKQGHNNVLALMRFFTDLNIYLFFLTCDNSSTPISPTFFMVSDWFLFFPDQDRCLGPHLEQHIWLEWKAPAIQQIYEVWKSNIGPLRVSIIMYCIVLDNLIRACQGSYNKIDRSCGDFQIKVTGERKYSALTWKRWVHRVIWL